MIHKTAIVEQGTYVHPTAKVWHFTHVRSGAIIDRAAVVGMRCYIDRSVHIPCACRIQNGVNIYRGVMLSDRVFVGPNVTFTNDDSPRAGEPFELKLTYIGAHASICAGAVVRCGIRIGRYAMIACGAVVTRDVEPFELYKGYGNGPKEKVDETGKRVNCSH